ncbi:DNA topoisomerase [Mycotypha africana]|uniref:DNA topoisomerase n=1 Tax=Mycotypha africana TaxID=64632 RepID=UPI002300E054|nr:DNA topoisomerase [Mycotypha africana]KAI8970127.1 DNA topoisomerase [Mycotypha africana]
MKPLMNNIRNQTQRADVLFVWTDCDREGEAIGGDLADYCRTIKPGISVWRARFSAMQPADIHRAAQQHDILDMKQISAVRARSELDLRIGAAFTRFQTLQLRSYFQNSNDKKVLSYGSCQFPTLGFVVDRYLQHENFVQEEFWKIHMVYTEERENGEAPLSTTFKWRKEHVFERWACFLFYEMCYEAKIARVTKVNAKETQKWKPLPLTTVELQKTACRALHMSGAEIMTVAEGLYTQGFISYPRTETDQFEPGFNFTALIEKQIDDPEWGQYARILKDGEFQRPRNGKNNDKAHPPIHPTAYTNSLTGNAKKVYEFITRRFLACCWKNAIGHETSIEVQMGPEFFDAKGLVILERNYLEVYPYDKWKGNVIPEFQEGDEFVPATLEMVSGHTTPPNLLTESDLIGMMEKNEIGTDATIAEHIQKILDREYVFKQGPYFKPLTLGIALILGYDQIGFEFSLSKPFMRRKVRKTNLTIFICAACFDLHHLFLMLH